MAKWMSCQLEAEPDQPVMLNLDYVVMMKPQPGQSAKTLIELANGRTFWILNDLSAVSSALETAPPDAATVDVVAEAPVIPATVDPAPVDPAPVGQPPIIA